MIPFSPLTTPLRRAGRAADAPKENVSSSHSPPMKNAGFIGLSARSFILPLAFAALFFAVRALSSLGGIQTLQNFAGVVDAMLTLLFIATLYFVTSCTVLPPPELPDHHRSTLSAYEVSTQCLNEYLQQSLSISSALAYIQNVEEIISSNIHLTQLQLVPNEDEVVTKVFLSYLKEIRDAWRKLGKLNVQLLIDLQQILSKANYLMTQPENPPATKSSMFTAVVADSMRWSFPEFGTRAGLFTDGYELSIVLEICDSVRDIGGLREQVDKVVSVFDYVNNGIMGASQILDTCNPPRAHPMADVIRQHFPDGVFVSISEELKKGFDRHKLLLFNSSLVEMLEGRRWLSKAHRAELYAYMGRVSDALKQSFY